MIEKTSLDFTEGLGEEKGVLPIACTVPPIFAWAKHKIKIEENHLAPGRQIHQYLKHPLPNFQGF